MSDARATGPGRSAFFYAVLIGGFVAVIAAIAIFLGRGGEVSTSPRINYANLCIVATQHLFTTPSTFRRIDDNFGDTSPVQFIEFDIDNAFGASVRHFATCEFATGGELTAFQLDGVRSPELLDRARLNIIAYRER